MIVDGGRDEARDGARRPPRQRDQARARARRADFRPAHPEEVAERLGPPGFIGPVGAQTADPARRGGRARRLRDRRQPARRAPARRRAGPRLPVRDRRRAHASWPATPSTARRSGSSRRSRSATSSSSGRATPSRSARPTSTSPGKEQLIWMGSYGFGPARAAAAAVEQYADEHGISWPRSIAPFDVELVVARASEGSEERALADRLYASCSEPGCDVLYDDRDAGPGREVRRRRAARLPAAGHGRPAHARGRRDRGAGPPRARVAHGADRGRGRRRSPSSGGSFPSGARGRERRSPSGACSGSTARARRPPQTLLRPAAATRGRSRTRSATSGWR